MANVSIVLYYLSVFIKKLAGLALIGCLSIAGYVGFTGVAPLEPWLWGAGLALVNYAVYACLAEIKRGPAIKLIEAYEYALNNIPIILPLYVEIMGEYIKRNPRFSRSIPPH